MDAFHPVNVGRILIGNYVFLPCTPAGCQELINRAYGDPKGKEVVVVGRSNIVGKPMVAIMIQKKAGRQRHRDLRATPAPPRIK